MDNGSDLSQRILRAARQLFFARGFANASLRAIATEAGTSESGILRIFRSKRGLLRAVYASAWAEVNVCVDDAMSRAIARDADPRNLLLELARAVLGCYEEDPQKMQFVVSSFGFRDTSGLGPPEEVDPVVDAQIREEYHRYLNRIHDLCDAIMKNHPRLGAAGVTPATLGHFATSIIYGMQTAWYMAAQEEEAGVPQVTSDEVVTALRFFLYEEHTAEQQDLGGATYHRRPMRTVATHAPSDEEATRGASNMSIAGKRGKTVVR